jgi:glycosyltransferase involved in cell wall biosynthesis
MKLASDILIKVGIALAAYRPRNKYFVKQLESIENQTHQNWICVITCDSPLEAVFQAPAIQRFRNHPRFLWFENENRLGCKKNFERAIQLCLKENVQAVACSDQDDVWYPEKIALSVKELRKRPALSLVHTDMNVLVMRGSEEVVLPETLWKIESRGVEHSNPIHFLIRDTASGAAMLFDAELARLHSVIPDEFEFHDAWYAFLAAAYGGVYPIRKPLYAYRQHSRNVLGVTPFKGVFHSEPGNRLKDILLKCRQKYFLSRGMAVAALRDKVPLPPKAGWIFISPLDLGLGFFVIGIVYSIGRNRDIPLVRAAWARAIGKLLSIFFSKPDVGFLGQTNNVERKS